MRRALVTTVVVVLAGAVLAQNDRQSDPDEHVMALHKAIRAADYDQAFKVLPLVEDIETESTDENRYGSDGTALGLAAQAVGIEAYDLAKALIEKYGADPNLADSSGLTPLHHAAGRGNLSIVDLLVRHGAKVDAEVEGDNPLFRGMTPINIALRFRKNRIAEALRAYGAEAPSRQDREETEVAAAFDKGFVEAFKAMSDNRGGDPRGTVHAMHRFISEAMIQGLEHAGSTDQANAWRNFSPEQIDALIAQNPAPQDGSSTSEWASQMLIQIAAEIERGGQ